MLANAVVMIGFMFPPLCFFLYPHLVTGMGCVIVYSLFIIAWCKRTYYWVVVNYNIFFMYNIIIALVVGIDLLDICGLYVLCWIWDIMLEFVIWHYKMQDSIQFRKRWKEHFPNDPYSVGLSDLVTFSAWYFYFRLRVEIMFPCHIMWRYMQQFPFVHYSWEALEYRTGLLLLNTSALIHFVGFVKDKKDKDNPTLNHDGHKYGLWDFRDTMIALGTPKTLLF
eukprot:UN31892